MDTAALFAAFHAEDPRPVYGCLDLTFGGDALAQLCYRVYAPKLYADVMAARAFSDWLQR